MHTELIEHVDRTQPIVRGWDRLAAQHGRPYCSPAWMLAWWRHLASPGARLALIAVRDGGDVVAVAPFFAVRRQGTVVYRLLAARNGAPTQPLAEAGMERRASEEIARCLKDATLRPNAIVLDGVPAASGWTSALSSAWGCGPARHFHDRTRPLTVLSLRERSYRDWMSARTAKFRKGLGRLRRRLEEQGAVFRMTASSDDIHSDIEMFLRLHEGRWDSRGGSAVVRSGTGAMLREVAEELVPQGRFRLWSIELNGETVAAEIFVNAGGTSSDWLGGFDPRFATYSPGMLVMLAGIEHAWQAGDDRVDFGAGDHRFKHRFADQQEPLEWSILVPPGHGSIGAWAQIANRAIAKRLPGDVKARLRRVRASALGR
jgi:CelD/BcsL family acetyltransferase involved in cellulose biosynthesis